MSNFKQCWVSAIGFSSLMAISLSAFGQWGGGGDKAAIVLVEPITFEYEETKVDAVGTAEALSLIHI